MEKQSKRIPSPISQLIKNSSTVTGAIGTGVMDTLWSTQLKVHQGHQKFPFTRPVKAFTTPGIYKPGIYSGVTGGLFSAMHSFSTEFGRTTEKREKTLMAIGAISTGGLGGGMLAARTNLFQKIGAKPKPVYHMTGLKQMFQNPAARRAMIKGSVGGMVFGGAGLLYSHIHQKRQSKL